MRILGLDIGRRHTGVAFLDESNGIPLPLDTLHHASSEELISAVSAIVDGRSIDLIVIGLPLLPSGDEGSQVSYVRDCGHRLEKAGASVTYIDERYTTTKDTSVDGDAKAACDLLSLYQERVRRRAES